jgi:hypothetical protein
MNLLPKLHKPKFRNPNLHFRTCSILICRSLLQKNKWNQRWLATFKPANVLSLANRLVGALLDNVSAFVISSHLRLIVYNGTPPSLASSWYSANWWRSWLEVPSHIFMIMTRSLSSIARSLLNITRLKSWSRLSFAWVWPGSIASTRSIMSWFSISLVEEIGYSAFWWVFPMVDLPTPG